MRQFIKRPDLGMVTIPGVGRVSPGQVLEGDQYARFAPTLLTEVPQAPQKPQVEPPRPPPPAAPMLTEVLPTNRTLLLDEPVSPPSSTLLVDELVTSPGLTLVPDESDAKSETKVVKGDWKRHGKR